MTTDLRAICTKTQTSGLINIRSPIDFFHNTSTLTVIYKYWSVYR